MGQRSSHWAWTGSTRATGVCWSMYSETITDHGVAAAERHGRSRACSSYHRSSGAWRSSIAADRRTRAWHHRLGPPAAYRGPMTSMTRGPLPARVYWTRRLLLVAASSDWCSPASAWCSWCRWRSERRRSRPGPGRRRRPGRAGPPRSRTDERHRRVDERPGRARDGPGKKQQPGPRVRCWPSPEGPCVDRDIAVDADGAEDRGRRPGHLHAQLRTILTPACTWEVSPELADGEDPSGDDDIWFSTECRRSIPTRTWCSATT